MNGTKAVLDSNVIILASKDRIDVVKLLSEYEEIYVSIITYVEVYAFDFQNLPEKDAIDEIFANLEIIEINQEIADWAIVYRKNKSKKIKLPDAVILATARYASADLLTDDWKDFQNIDSSVDTLNLDEFKV